MYRRHRMNIVEKFLIVLMALGAASLIGWYVFSLYSECLHTNSFMYCHAILSK
jgi:hypothetical protein